MLQRRRTWNRVFSRVKTWNRPKIKVKSWFAILVVIVKSPYLAREFVKNAICYRGNVMVTLYFCDLFIDVYIWKFMKINRETGHFVAWKRERHRILRYPNCPSTPNIIASSINQIAVAIQGPDLCSVHDDVIKWEHFPRYWPFVRGIHRPPVNSPHKGQWCGVVMFSFICARINGWVNNREAGDLRRHRSDYDVIVTI